MISSEAGTLNEHGLPRMVKVSTAAWLLGTSKGKVRGMLRSGELAGVRIGSFWRVSMDGLLDMFGI